MNERTLIKTQRLLTPTLMNLIRGALSISVLTIYVPVSFKITPDYGERRTDSGHKKGNEVHGGHRSIRGNKEMNEGEVHRSS